MAASKLAVAVWIGSAAVLATGTSAAVYSLAGSSTPSASAAAKASPTPSPSSSLTGGGGSLTAPAAKPSPTPTPTSTAPTTGNGNGNNGNGNGGSTSGGHPITLTGSVTGQPGPGVTATLKVTIDNSKNQAITVRTVTATVTSVTSGTQAGKPQCKTSWYSISAFSGSLPIAAGAKGVVPLTVTFTDDPAINQDNCRGATYSFSYSASADQA